MKHSMLQMAVLGALCAQATGNNDNAGAAPKAREVNVKIPEKVDSWLALGKKEGNRVREATDKAEMLARDIVLTYGEHLCTGSDGVGPSANDWLTGYASSWANVNTAKVRKSEAKAVFDAFAIGNEVRSIVVGYNKETKEVIKEEHKVSEWLKQHAETKGYEGYPGLVRMAKEMRGAATGQGAGGGAGNRRRSVVTEKQSKEIEESIPLMNTQQATTVVEKATAQLTKLPQFEGALFREISMICNQIKVKSQDKGHLELASNILDMVTTHLDRIESDRLKAAGTTPAKAPTAPAPAQQPQPQQETAKAA